MDKVPSKLQEDGATLKKELLKIRQLFCLQKETFGEELSLHVLVLTIHRDMKILVPLEDSISNLLTMVQKKLLKMN